MYGRAVEEISVMRSETTELEEPSVYNDFMRALKRKLLGEELGGDRREMWGLIRKHGLGLIETKISERSEVGEDEARKVSSFCCSYHV